MSEPVTAPISAGELELEAFDELLVDVDWKRRGGWERGTGTRVQRAARDAFEATLLDNMLGRGYIGRGGWRRWFCGVDGGVDGGKN